MSDENQTKTYLNQSITLQSDDTSSSGERSITIHNPENALKFRHDLKAAMRVVRFICQKYVTDLEPSENSEGKKEAVQRHLQNIHDLESFTDELLRETQRDV